MAHELSSENLRRVVRPKLWRHGSKTMLSLLAGTVPQPVALVFLRLHPLRNGVRRISVMVLLSHNDNGAACVTIPLGTISTVAELREWYVRLGGKWWDDAKR